MAAATIQFIDADEYEVGRLGSNTMGGGGVNSQHCVLTNKRLYHKGVTFGTGGAGLQNGENIVNIADVTCSGYYIVRHILPLIIGFLCLIGFVAAGFVAEVMALAAVGAVVGGIFILVYFVKQQRVFKVSFGGGMLVFEVKGCNEQSLRDFNRLIQQAAAYAKKN